jgi:hypothetical protein
MAEISKSLNIARRIYRRMFRPTLPILTDYIFDQADIQDQEASDLIRTLIIEGKPLLVSRLGTELFALLNYKEVSQDPIKKKYKLYFR